MRHYLCPKYDTNIRFPSFEWFSNLGLVLLFVFLFILALMRSLSFAIHLHDCTLPMYTSNNCSSYIFLSQYFTVSVQAIQRLCLCLHNRIIMFCDGLYFTLHLPKFIISVQHLHFFTYSKTKVSFELN